MACGPAWEAICVESRKSVVVVGFVGMHGWLMHCSAILWVDFGFAGHAQNHGLKQREESTDVPVDQPSPQDDPIDVQHLERESNGPLPL